MASKLAEPPTPIVVFVVSSALPFASSEYIISPEETSTKRIATAASTVWVFCEEKTPFLPVFFLPNSVMEPIIM